eukprot:CAMPEP_0196741936 /NCGR_PEP_ID=MMETSP1091-20130531/43560_1 /TAXON_ID=302021 /ORGANISM="Rhodomonas sp., Strain CCMP768" /LENGTH=71 /DNA_ID=CAMNT_0042087819 /DNA_START=177 /DNA_END=392 /DNA_ORIENTATION=+
MAQVQAHRPQMLFSPPPPSSQHAPSSSDDDDDDCDDDDDASSAPHASALSAGDSLSLAASSEGSALGLAGA